MAGDTSALKVSRSSAAHQRALERPIMLPSGWKGETRGESKELGTEFAVSGTATVDSSGEASMGTSRVADDGGSGLHRSSGGVVGAAP